MNDPSRRADQIRTAYQQYLRDQGGLHAKHVAARLQPDEAGETTLTGMRGPYMEALDVANWSDTDWEEFAQSQNIHPNVIRAFQKEGVRRLYDFQERSIQSITAGDNTVISAATGRGKTEAWLIPLLDSIVKGKRNEGSDGRTSTKALLLYPTKALAQDQFKRLVQVLYRINRHLRGKERITVGIYDGDTPRHIYEDGAQGYLNRTFDFLGCPGANSDLEKCRNCSQGVFVERTTNDFKLRPDLPDCETDPEHPVPLDFVKLTRSAISNDGADIILTNPDTLNFRLLNVNAETERDMFALEPEHLVFDEVHTYSGLLGSYTSSLVKRLRTLRDAQDVDPLQVVGASATVANDETLFRQISGVSQITPVREAPRQLDPDDVESPPQELLEESVSISRLAEAGRPTVDPPAQVGNVSLTVQNASDLDDDGLRERISDYLFDYLTEEEPSDPVVQTYQELHGELKGDPRPPAEFRAWVRNRFDLAADEAETLVDNFETVGQFSGLLDSRHHLFSWPLDGCYACLECQAVYRSPQDSCEYCGGSFVTRATYCRECHEEHFIANSCSRCEQLSPYVHTEEGLIGAEEPDLCPRCLNGDDEAVPMNRVVFNPTLECESCGERTARSYSRQCSECSAPCVATPSGNAVCRNPDCGHVLDVEQQCTACGATEFSAVRIAGGVTCTDCGTEHDPVGEPECCGQAVDNTRFIPWVCTNCDQEHFTAEPPSSCACDSASFVRGGLYQIVRDFECDTCGVVHLPGVDCGCDDPDPTERTEPYRRYQAVTDEFVVRPAVDAQASYPCDHSYYSTVVGQAFDQLMRSPTNVGVTTSQYLLREVASEESFEESKLLSFSDSHQDMKDLDRSFTDPETDTLLDQLLIAATELAASGAGSDAIDDAALRNYRPGRRDESETTSWVALSEILDTADDLLDALDAELSDGDASGPALRELIVTGRKQATSDAVRTRLRRHAIDHGGYDRFVSPLASEGLLDVRLPTDLLDSLSGDQRRIVQHLIDAGFEQQFEDLPLESLDAPIGSVLGGLNGQGIIERSGDTVHLATTIFEVTLPEGGDIRYDPHEDRFVPTLEADLEQVPDAVPCDDSLLDRADPSSPRFSARADSITRTRLLTVLSELYFGNTPKKERREIEHRFRDSPTPNFLSSGPAMELGVDIGSLDALLLNGTPPNMNAYLQRVGRAGRSSQTALVHSVSHRNPIDYYYYDRPAELITAQKQPVPLDEHNERVLEISLVWAVLDFIASEFMVPWNVTQHSVSGGEDFQHRDEVHESARHEAGKFTKLLATDVGTLSLGSDENRLRPLSQIVADHEQELNSYLERILGYAYCPNCHRRFDTEQAGDACPGEECQEKLLDAATEYRDLIEQAPATFLDVFVNGFDRHVDQIRRRIADAEDRVADVRERHAEASGEERDRLSRERVRAEERADVLESHLEDVEDASFYEFLKDAFAQYAFNLRDVADTVEIRIDDGGDTVRLGDGERGRSKRLALSELHPGAAYLHERDPHVVARVSVDEKGTADLEELVTSSMDVETDAELDGLTAEVVCPECGRADVRPDGPCSCGTDAEWTERRLLSVGGVDLFHRDANLPNEQDDAGSVYDRPGMAIQSTFARKNTQILEFEPTRRFELLDHSDSRVGTISLGDYQVLEYTESAVAKYENGTSDDAASPFELCMEDDCDGFIYEDRNGVDRCSVNPDHQPRQRGTDSSFARIGYSFPTEGLRVSLDGDKGHHTFGHGLRVALQQLSGVSIREVGEHLTDQHVDLFDTEEGGAAVSRQLVRERGDEFPNFQTATRVIRQQFDCDCSEGCPHCLYQYGCAERNRPSTFDREAVSALLDPGGLSLRPLDR